MNIVNPRLFKNVHDYIQCLDEQGSKLLIKVKLKLTATCELMGISFDPLFNCPMVEYSCQQNWEEAPITYAGFPAARTFFGVQVEVRGQVIFSVKNNLLKVAGTGQGKMMKI